MSTTGSRRTTYPAWAVAQGRRPATRDVLTVMRRELLPVLRDPFSVVFGLIQPLFFLALYGPLLVGSMSGTPSMTGDPGGVWAWFVPAILVMVTLFGTASTGSNLLYEFQTGTHERMLVTPLARSSLFLGRALKEVVPLAAQALIVTLVMVPFGFRFHLVGGALGILLLAVLGLGVGSLSYALAIAVRKVDWMFWVVQQTVLFPVMILSGMLLPLETGPGWMQALARGNPLSHVVEAERALFGGSLTSSTVLVGFVAAFATALLGVLVGLRALRGSID